MLAQRKVNIASCIIIPCFTVFVLLVGFSTMDIAFTQSEDALRYFAKGTVTGEHFKDSVIWTQINNAQITIIDTWESQRTKFQGTVTQSIECESNYQICLDAKVTHVLNTAAIRVGDKFVIKVDAEDNVQKYEWLSGNLKEFEIEAKVTRDSKKSSKSIIDVGNDIFPKDIDEYTFARGNPQSDIVLVYAQGGPTSLLDTEGLSHIYDSGMHSKLKDALFVNVHQAQTLMPELFVENSISFDQAKQHDAKTTQMLYKVIKYFKDDGKTVYVVGISFGAFVVQDLLVANGNIADGYLIMVGRLNIQDAIWTSFSKGIVMEFDDDALTPIMANDIGKDHGVSENMHKLAAGLGHKRYVELLEDVNLSNVVYVYGEKDNKVGKLSDLELEFLHSHNATVLKSQNGHLDAVYEKLDEGIQKMADTLN